MTRDEAIEILKDLWRYEHSEFSEESIREALDKAIKALKQKPIIDKIRTEIEKLQTTKCTETRRTYMNADDFKKNVLVILDKCKKESEDNE